MAKTYLFYDLETSGINKSFDQIMQFAAIRTDVNLNEIERVEFLVKLNPDTIVDPQALVVHHIPISKVNRDGISEYDAALKIHELINTPNTVSIGYNNLGFDDEFLRFTFFRNLLSSYTHQFADGCFRMDLYPMVALYYLYDNGRLKFPITDDKVSLKLELLNQENGFFKNGRSHDAMVDVEVTIGLARALKGNSSMWDYLEKKFNKLNDEDVLKKLNTGVVVKGEEYQQAIMISGHFGGDNSYHIPVINLGQHRVYRNQTCWLRLDSPKLREINEECIEKKIWVQKKKWGEPPFILPVKSKYTRGFTNTRINEIKKNKEWIDNNPDKFLSIVEIILDRRHDEIKNIDIDASLYSSDFIKNWEQKICNEFHKRDICGKVNLLDELEGGLRSRAIRILGRLNFNLLSDRYKDEYYEYIEKVSSFDENDYLIDYRGNKRRSVPDAFDRIQELKDNYQLSKEQINLLDELEEYISQ